jgi:iron complex outermembrane receptor protein
MSQRSAFQGILASGVALAALMLPGAVAAQATIGSTPEAATPTGAETPTSDATLTGAPEGERDILVTGSRIRQDPNRSALPLQIITTQELGRNSISSPEQLISFLSTNGTGADNLASNGDVTSGAQRGTNGLSAANLRGQGPAATLVLLNGRRLAAHGLTGGAVDVNQVPFAAIERIEVLKDGASAIYGTDAVGGVINFITYKHYEGLGLQGFTDVTQEGDGNIYRLSGIAGWGDMDEQGFNVMASASYSWNQILRGEDRKFVNGNQPNRGLSVDTRGTPIATAFPLNPSAAFFPGGTLLGGTTGATVLSGLVFPGTTQLANGGINPLDLPGGAGCGSVDGGMAYDEQLWSVPSARYACSWDTGRAAVIQQPIETLTYYARGAVRLGEAHEFSVEVTGSSATSAKSFSNNQISGNTTSATAALPVAFPLNDLTRATYNQVFSVIAAQFPAVAANYGKPIGYRWRCVACDVREYETDVDTLRVSAAIEGPLWTGWDYRAGASYARSEASSVLGSGYHYRGTLGNGAADPNAPTAPGASAPGIVGVLNSGLINPFTLDQSAAGLAALDAVSAEGATLYGGKYEIKQFDASVSGALFSFWGRDVQLAVGADYRRETYSFNGSPAAVATAPTIFNAAFDNINALPRVNRDVKAAYAELLVPLGEMIDITGAVRVDDYTGFGTTTNPKVSFRFQPIDAIMFRGSYNTSFRVPAFNQIFNGITESPYSGSDLADPVRCPGGVPNTTNPACAIIRPSVYTGGRRELGPETAEQFNLGVVIQPAPMFSASVDWWIINVDNTIQTLTLRQLVENATLFPDAFPRDAAGEIEIIDNRWLNAGSRRSQGLEVALRGGADAAGGRFLAGLDGTYLLKRREKLTPTAQYGPSLIGTFTFAGDLALRWKHNAFVSYQNDDFLLSLTQIFRNGYRNSALPGIASGAITRPDFNPRVKDYITYNASVAFTGIEGYRLTLGVKNVFDKDPPFAITYDGNTGAGSSWEPRVADPRGRAFTASVETKF